MYKVGDKITVEFTVVESEDINSHFQRVVDGDKNRYHVLKSAIVGHTPAPWVPKAGDEVMAVGIRYKIIFIDDKNYITEPLNPSLRRCLGSRSRFDSEYTRAD